MPRYEYHCDACGKNFEVNQRMSDDPLNRCECGVEGKVHRLMSAGNGIIFKGSGFYQTDYKGASAASTAAKSADSPAAAPATATPAAATTSESKSVDKPSASGGGGCGSGCGCH